MLFTCSQSPPAVPLMAGLARSAFLAASENPNSSKWSAQRHSQRILPSQLTSTILSSIRSLSEISGFSVFSWVRMRVLSLKALGSWPGA